MKPRVSLPYFDILLGEIQNGKRDIATAFGRHVHWGYWDDAHPSDGTMENFVAAGDRALGRKPVRDFPPGPLPRARPSTDAEIVAWMADLYREDTPIAEALGRAALAMAREAGPTVPRAAVAAVVPLLAGVSTMLADSDDAEAKREAVRRLDRIIVALGRMVTDGPTPTEDR